MSGMLNMLTLEGSLERRDSSTHLVTIWYIPTGINHHQSKAVDVYFDTEHQARVFEKKWASPPESAFMVSLQELDDLKTRIEKTFHRI